MSQPDLYFRNNLQAFGTYKTLKGYFHDFLEQGRKIQMKFEESVNRSTRLAPVHINHRQLLDFLKHVQTLLEAVCDTNTKIRDDLPRFYRIGGLIIYRVSEL